MGKTFAQALDKACRKQGSKSLDMERERVHQDAIRDGKHAFRNVDIPSTGMRYRRTSLTI